MKKKMLSLCLALLVLLSALTGALADEYQLTGVTVTAVEAIEDAFSSGDVKDVSSEEPNAVITLAGETGTISDTTRGSSGSTVTITSKGVYRVTGAAENVTILIDDESESGNVYLVLDNVTMTNDAAPCICVSACDKLIIQCVGANSLTATHTAGDYGAAIYASDDLTINGSGSLSVTAAQDGIICKDDLKITGAAMTIAAGEAGIDANDSVRIGGGSVSITAAKDGIHVENSSGDSWFYLESGEVSINAAQDGIDVNTSGDSFTGSLTLAGGALSVTAGGGSGSSKDGNASQKGLKCAGDIYVGDVQLSVSSADDAIHSGASISLTGGALTLSSSDDGVHADSALSISGGELNVTKAYEGLEAYEISISGGSVSVYASDDGVNAAGGSDSASGEAGPWAMFTAGSSTGTLTVSGGTLYVNAGGDGLDSNGSLYVTGGLVIVEGPTDNGNGALDRGDGSGCVASITGGTVLAIGSSGMAVNFDSGTQCSGLVSLSGRAGDTITVDDGSGFSFTASKSFQCVVYSSPSLQRGQTYTVTAGGASASMSFASGLYYSGVSGMGGFGMTGGGKPGGMGGR